MSYSTVTDILGRTCAELNIPIPQVFVGSTDPDARQLLALFHAVGRDILKKRLWPQLKRIIGVNLAAGVTDYLLPEDYYSLLPFTGQDPSNRRRLVGPLTEGQWNDRKFISVVSTQRAYRIFGVNDTLRGAKALKIDPAPSSVDYIQFEYLSLVWIYPRLWAPSIPVIFNEYRTASGNIYRCTQAGTTNPNLALPPSHTSGDAPDGTASWGYRRLETATATSDLDISLFDEDVMILGIKWMFAQAKGFDYSQLRIDYENALAMSFSRSAGPEKISMGEEISYSNLSEGSFG